MIINFTYSWENIFGYAKYISSLFAVRQKSTEPDAANPFVPGQASAFEELVFDEDNLQIFRSFFAEAIAEVDIALAAYTKNLPQQTNGRHDAQSIASQKDYVLWLSMPASWNENLKPAAETKIKEFLALSVLSKWYLDKQPNVAAIYGQRAEGAVSQAKEALSARKGSLTRTGHFW
jgi:hypothetical protein